MKKSNGIQNNDELKEAIAELFFYDYLDQEDAAKIFNDIEEYLYHTPAIYLIPVEGIIRESYKLTNDGFWGEILEDIGVAKAELAAFRNGVFWGEVLEDIGETDWPC